MRNMLNSGVNPGSMNGAGPQPQAINLPQGINSPVDGPVPPGQPVNPMQGVQGAAPQPMQPQISMPQEQQVPPDLDKFLEQTNIAKNLDKELLRKIGDEV